MRPDDRPVVKIGRIKRVRDFDAPQPAEPHLIVAHEMDDLAADGADGVADMPGELLLREGGDTGVPEFAVFGEVIAVQVAEGVRVHGAACSSVRR